MDRKLLKQLPTDARQKFEALSRKRDAAFAELRGLADERTAALERLHDFAGRRRKDLESEKQTLENDAREKDHRDDIVRIQSISDDAARATDLVRNLAGRCEEWVEFVVGAGSRLLPLKVAAPQSLNITSIRRKLSENAHQIEQTQSAPALHSDLLARSMGALDALADLGRPSINPAERHGDPFNLADKLSLLSLVAAPGGVGQAFLTPGSVQFFAWLFRDLLEKKITDVIASAPQDGALDNAARDKRLRELYDERLILERQEELLIEASERAGTAIARRPGCDVRAVLGVIDA